MGWVVWDGEVILVGFKVFYKRGIIGVKGGSEFGKLGMEMN